MELGAGGRYLRPLCSQEHGALCWSNREQEPGSIPHSALWPPWDGVEGIDWWCRGLTSKATLPYTARSCCSLGSCSAPCLWQEKPLSLLLTHTAVPSALLLFLISTALHTGCTSGMCMSCPAFALAVPSSAWDTAPQRSTVSHIPLSHRGPHYSAPSSLCCLQPALSCFSFSSPPASGLLPPCEESGAHLLWSRLSS